MIDRQFIGEGIVGELAGKTLTMIPSPLISFDDFITAYPEGVVLSRDTGFSRSYGQIPYVGYDDPDNAPFLFRGNPDRRLSPKERVAAVTIGGVDIAFPFTVLERERVVSYADGEAVVFFKPGTLSALDKRRIDDSCDVGATGIFDARLDGRKLTFRPDGDRFVDNETGTVWNILGQAIDGHLAGSQLTHIVHGNHFWFAWGVFKPDTLVYRGMV